MQYIHVKVTAGAKKESFVKKSPDHFEVSVREKAERNMANTRVLELMAEYFKVSKHLAFPITTMAMPHYSPPQYTFNFFPKAITS